MSLKVHRRWLWLALSSLSGSLAAQQVATETPQAWQADAKANKQAQKSAEEAAAAAQPPMRGGKKGEAGKGPRPSGAPAGGGADGGPPGGNGGGPEGEGGPPGGGMGGMGGGGHGGHGGHGKHGGHGEGQGGGGPGTPAAMLRPEMDFAAPLKDTLVLYRSREAVVFGRKESADAVILPLDGSPVPVAPGVQASLHEDAQGLRVEVATSNDIHVNYRYAADAEGVLRVSVHAEGPVPRPGSQFEVERVYRAQKPR